MKEKIEARIEELKKAQEQATAQLNAIMGAIGELSALLVEKPIEEDKKD